VPLTAALIDDHVLFREGLKRLFELYGTPSVVGEASGAPAAYDVVSATRPDVVVLDVLLSGGESGIGIAERLLRRNPRQRILFLSMVKDRAQVEGALQTGALGYATKDQGAHELLEALRMVGAGHRYLAPSLAARHVMAAVRGVTPHLGLLTGRERQVFDLTVTGLTSREIGDRLAISSRTVETHRVRILRKLDAHSATDLARIAAREGLLE
jgi:DNA-binding NarL/FixJ family response regulator